MLCFDACQIYSSRLEEDLTTHHSLPDESIKSPMVLFTEYVDWVVVQAKKKFNFDILAQLERARPDFHPLWELEMERQKIEHVVRKLPEAAVKSQGRCQSRQDRRGQDR
jgi:hypothetical protein